MSYYDTFIEFVQNYEELVSKWKKLIKNIKSHSNVDEKSKKFYLINQQINHLNLDIVDFLVEIDQESFRLTPEEEKRIEDAMEVDRALDRAKPFFILSMLMEAQPLPDFKSQLPNYPN